MTLVKNLSANTAQLIFNQLCGLAIFFVLSNNLSKNEFGQLNLVLAILLTAFNILSFGIDQIAVRKIAAGEDIEHVLSNYVWHVIITGVSVYGILLVVEALFKSNSVLSPILLLIGFGKLLIFFSSPFKQAAAGKEEFRLLAYMSIVSNFLRSTALLAMALLHSVTLSIVIVVFILGDIVELLLCIYLCRFVLKKQLNISWNYGNYKSLLTEAVPQLGVVIFTSLISRFDWIFIGMVLSSMKLAEYSFAYKIFELCTLPLLALAPLLLPWFTRALNGSRVDYKWLRNLVRYELIIATFSALLLCICWTTVIDFLTAGRYGAVNAGSVFWLALCIPFLYFNNFLWTICFAKQRMNFILFVIAVTSAVIIVGDVLLIPVYKNEGAAIACFIALVVQAALYSLASEVKPVLAAWFSLIVCISAAFMSAIFAEMMSSNSLIIALYASVIFFTLLTCSRQIKTSDRSCLRRIFSDFQN